MRNFFAVLLIGALTVTLPGCGSQKTDNESSVDSSESSAAEEVVSKTESTTEKATKAAVAPTTAPCAHEWTEANCQSPAICSKCGAQNGAKAEHQWLDADCTTPKTCAVCGETSGNPADHIWLEATCAAPKTCQVCGETSGIALSHSWESATCTQPRTCRVCGATDGEAKGHSWKEATYDAPKTCRTCGATEGEPLDASAMYQLSISTPLPADFNYYNFHNEIVDTVQITEVTYEFEPSNYSNDAKLVIYFTGTKVYDNNGSGQSRSAKVSVKLYDSEGYVVDNKTFYSPGIKNGESFRNEEVYFYDVAPGSYTIELLNTN